MELILKQKRQTTEPSEPPARNNTNQQNPRTEPTVLYNCPKRHCGEGSWRGSLIVQLGWSSGWCSTVTPLFAGSGTVTSRAVKRPSEVEAGTACTEKQLHHTRTVTADTWLLFSTGSPLLDTDWTKNKLTVIARPKIPSHVLLVLMLTPIWWLYMLSCYERKTNTVIKDK